MSRLNLTSWQRRRLRRQLAETRDARPFRRTLAVLEFDHGRSAADIARMLGVTRKTIYACGDHANSLPNRSRSAGSQPAACSVPAVSPKPKSLGDSASAP